jgi:hypothetical protein
MDTGRTGETVAESAEVRAQIERSTSYDERPFPFHVRQLDRDRYQAAFITVDVEDEFGDRIWHGTRGEWMDFLTAVGRHCGHNPGRSICAQFCAWRGDQREWDGLLFARRMSARLVAAEMTI